MSQTHGGKLVQTHLGANRVVFPHAMSEEDVALPHDPRDAEGGTAQDLIRRFGWLRRTGSGRCGGDRGGRDGALGSMVGHDADKGAVHRVSGARISGSTTTSVVAGPAVVDAEPPWSPRVQLVTDEWLEACIAKGELSWAGDLIV